MYRRVQELEEADIGHVLFTVGRGLISKMTIIFIFIEWGLYTAFILSYMSLKFFDRYYGVHILLLNVNYTTCLLI